MLSSHGGHLTNAMYHHVIQSWEGQLLRLVAKGSTSLTHSHSVAGDLVVLQAAFLFFKYLGESWVMTCFCQGTSKSNILDTFSNPHGRDFACLNLKGKKLAIAFVNKVTMYKVLSNHSCLLNCRLYKRYQTTKLSI